MRVLVIIVTLLFASVTMAPSFAAASQSKKVATVKNKTSWMKRK